MIENLNMILQQASSGDEKAQQQLLAFFETDALSGEQFTQVFMYLKAQSSHHAIYLQGLLYRYGYGTSQNLDMAFLSMREAASKGNAKAIYEVGHYFLEGIGVSQNNEEALQWLSLAADSPHYIPEAMYDLAIMYEKGMGVQQDSETAKSWYEKAASKGHRQARDALK